MKNTFARIALAALLAAPATMLANPTPETRPELKIAIPKGATPAQLREALKKQGLPDDVIEKIVAQYSAQMGGSGANITPDPDKNASGANAPQGGQPGANAGGNGRAANARPSLPPAPRADYLNAQALENKDPEFAKEQKVIEALRQEKALLEAEIALGDSKRREELAPLSAERFALEADRAIRAARTAAKNAAGDAEKARIEKEIAALNTRTSLELNEKNQRIAAIETEARLLRAKAEADAFAPSAAAAIRKTSKEAERVAPEEPVYLDDPVKDGTLYISDRRIPFNGVVCDQLADFVEKRIEFFNNKDPKKPIFIVIDSSPGGSVFSGVRILKAMKGSRAPVIVVVKQFCASMAAITTTMADRSYMYPNTVILHHQMSTGLRGNMTDLRQAQKFTETLYESVFKPVYTKIGYKSSAEFEKAMYAHFANGDWAAFGDDATRMKWAGSTVDRMVETGLRDMPEPRPEAVRMPFFAHGCVERQDETGRIYYELPPLSGPGDSWVLHDPDGRFKTAN